jgi:hypothetical protein
MKAQKPIPKKALMHTTDDDHNSAAKKKKASTGLTNSAMHRLH